MCKTWGWDPHEDRNCSDANPDPDWHQHGNSYPDRYNTWLLDVYLPAVHVAEDELHMTRLYILVNISPAFSTESLCTFREFLTTKTNQSFDPIRNYVKSLQVLRPRG